MSLVVKHPSLPSAWLREVECDVPLWLTLNPLQRGFKAHKRSSSSCSHSHASYSTFRSSFFSNLSSLKLPISYLFRIWNPGTDKLHTVHSVTTSALTSEHPEIIERLYNSSRDKSSSSSPNQFFNFFFFLLLFFSWLAFQFARLFCFILFWRCAICALAHPAWLFRCSWVFVQSIEHPEVFFPQRLPSVRK